MRIISDLLAAIFGRDEDLKGKNNGNWLGDTFEDPGGDMEDNQKRREEASMTEEEN